MKSTHLAVIDPEGNNEFFGVAAGSAHHKLLCEWCGFFDG